MTEIVRAKESGEGGNVMSKRMWVALVARLFCGVALFMGALALPAYADTILSGGYTATLTGVPKTTVTAGFNFDTTTDVFSGTLGFSGVFNVGESFSQAGACVVGTCALALSANVGGDSLVYTIALNLNSHQYTAAGTILNMKGQAGAWAYNGTDAVPENWGLSDSLGLFALALLAFGVLTRLGVLRTVHS